MSYDDESRMTNVNDEGIGMTTVARPFGSECSLTIWASTPDRSWRVAARKPTSI